MNRKELEEKGLSKEIVDFIMDQNGKDINNAKKDYDTMKEKFDAQTKTVEELQKGNVDNSELQKKIEELNQLNAKKDAEHLAYVRDNALDQAINGAKAKNPKAIKALLDNEKIKFENGSFVGLTEQLEALKKSDSYLFGDVNPTAEQFGKTVESNTGEQLTDFDIAWYGLNPDLKTK